jgi:hypothetical protein
VKANFQMEQQDYKQQQISRQNQTFTNGFLRKTQDGFNRTGMALSSGFQNERTFYAGPKPAGPLIDDA